MLRVSQFIKLTRLNLECQALRGQPIPVDAIAPICDLMRHMERECEVMEIKIAGEIVPLKMMQSPDDTVVSLADFAEARRKEPLNRTETKD